MSKLWLKTMIDAYFEIIKFSIQVCLGAIISALAFIIAQKHKNPVTLNKTNNRRIELFEEISAQIGQVNHSFAKYSTLIIESITFGRRWPEVRKEELDTINEELVSRFDQIADAEAKLLLLGESILAKYLRAYSAKMAQFRKQVYVGRQDISNEQIQKLKQEIIDCRENFYLILSKKYDLLLPSN